MLLFLSLATRELHLLVQEETRAHLTTGFPYAESQSAKRLNPLVLANPISNTCGELRVAVGTPTLNGVTRLPLDQRRSSRSKAHKSLTRKEVQTASKKLASQRRISTLALGTQGALFFMI